MKKKRLLSLYIVLIILILSGCSKDREEEISLEIWHYYNGAQKLAFDEAVKEFNENLGLEKGIIVEAYGQGNIGQLEGEILNSIEDKVGASKTPDMVTVYSETAYNLDKRDIIVNLENYLKEEEIKDYVDSYIEEGRLGKDKEFKIFPIAKATELLMVNKTDWDKFAQATGASIKDLESWEGIRRAGELYYNWTDSLTEDKNDGKAFFGRDALANYILVGSKQLGKEIFQVEEEEVRVDLQYDIMKKLWDNYYIPYISGYYSSYGKFSSDDAKIGEIIALVGSTTGATYFPENVTIDDNDSYPIELLVLPLPNFKDTSPCAVQQGAGIVVLESDQAHEEASVEFLKWFTQDARNREFSLKTGYLPVKKSAYSEQLIQEEFKEDSKQLAKQLQATLPLAMEQVENYNLYFSQAFKEGFKARSLLEEEFKSKAERDREKIINLMEEGMDHKDAVEKFSSEEKFKEWFLEFEEKLKRIVKDEE